MESALQTLQQATAFDKCSRACRLLTNALRLRPASFCQPIVAASSWLFLHCIDLMQRDSDLHHRDEYVNLVTSLRFKVESKHAANAVLLPYSHVLLDICMEALRDEPWGFAGACAMCAHDSM